MILYGVAVRLVANCYTAFTYLLTYFQKVQKEKFSVSVASVINTLAKLTLRPLTDDDDDAVFSSIVLTPKCKHSHIVSIIIINKNNFKHEGIQACWGLTRTTTMPPQS